MSILLIAILALAITYLGGYLASKIKDDKHILISFSAGTMLAVALFDLLPESFEILGDLQKTCFVVLVGFCVYFLLNNYLAITSHRDSECNNDHHHHHNFNIYGLTLHSLFDGLAIGFSFQASPLLGTTVAIGVLAHRFSDGINSVSLSIKNGNNALRWIHLNAFAPVIGIVIGSLLILPNNILGYILAFSAGLFLYISASDLVPECHHDHPKFVTSASFIVGIAFLLTILSCGHSHGHSHENEPKTHIETHHRH
jgi:ZIP family zinc transporter